MESLSEQNLVVIAAGGGNDVFSAIAYINSHHSNKNYNNVILFGILGLTPFHTNEPLKFNHVNIEEPIIIPTCDTKRYIMMKEQIFACESLLHKLVTPNITNYYCISSKYSAIEQANNIRKLFNELNISNLNTFIEIVDFGGDILTNGEQSSIISPELDAFSLAIARNLFEYRSHIVVCYPGVDGELNRSYLKDMCNSRHLIKVKAINSKLWLSQLKIIHETLNSFRPGNTIPNMINVLNKLDDCSISKSFTVGKDKYNYYKKIDIDMSLQSKIYYFNINIENPFVDIFNTKDYNLLSLLNNINQIYQKQIIDDDTL